MKQGLLCTIWHPELSVLLDFECGFGCTIHAPVWIGNGVLIGSNCSIQAFAFLPEGVILHDNVFIGPHVCFTNDKYPPTYVGPGGAKPVRPQTIVEDFVSIGANATILPGVRIGRGAMIGAGAVVTKNVPAHAKVIGSKIILNKGATSMAENDTGFQTSGYINKKGTSAPGNEMPPGMDIGDQSNADISEMKMKKLVPLSYPGSGQD